MQQTEDNIYEAQRQELERLRHEHSMVLHLGSMWSWLDRLRDELYMPPASEPNLIKTCDRILEFLAGWENTIAGIRRVVEEVKQKAAR